jgi:hypothetical protein
MIFANDNLAGGAIVGGLLFATTFIRVDAGCLAAISFTCLFLAFAFVFSTPVTGAWEVIGTDDCTCAGGSSGIASAISVGGGTTVGWFVSMTIRSGGCCIEAIRMTGLLTSSPVGSAKDCGRNQFATNSNTRSDVPTQAMYRPIGITISATATCREQTPYSLTVRNWTWLLPELPLISSIQEQARTGGHFRAGLIAIR